MSDSDGNFIPHVEDDQGEGIKDFYEEGDYVMEAMKKKLDGIERNDISQDEKSKSMGVQDRLGRIEEMVDRIHHALGDHVLINGNWVDIKKK